MCHRTGKYTVCRRVHASFSPKILKALAVKGLTVHDHTCIWMLFPWPLTRAGEMKGQEVELGSHGWMDCLAAELVLNSRFSDTVFVTLFRTAVETAVSEVRRNCFTLGGVPTAWTLLRFWDELLISTRPPVCPSLISPMVYVDAKHHERSLWRLRQSGLNREVGLDSHGEWNSPLLPVSAANLRTLSLWLCSAQLCQGFIELFAHGR